MITPSDEAKLVARMVQEDQDALTELLRIYGPKIRGWLINRFGSVLQPAEIDEACSVTFYNAWRFAHQHDSMRGALGTWLVGIASNAATSIIRNETKHRSKHVEYDDAYDPAWSTDHGDVHDDGNEYLDALQAAIEQLAPLQKAIIEADLAANGTADSDRLARVHDTSKNSIQVSRNKAHKRLAVLMAELGYDLTDGKIGYERIRR